MASATQSRGDDASRDEGVRLVEPTLTDTEIATSGCKPFAHLEPQIYIDQAYALLTCLAGGFRDAGAIYPSIINRQGLEFTSYFQEPNPDLMDEAIDGIATLAALARHCVDLRDHRAYHGRKAGGLGE